MLRQAPAVAASYTFSTAKAGALAEGTPLAVTTTALLPAAAPAGTVAVSEVSEFTTTPVAATPPKLTAVPATKLVPVRATGRPLSSELGVRPVTVGVGGAVQVTLSTKVPVASRLELFLNPLTNTRYVAPRKEKNVTVEALLAAAHMTSSLPPTQV